MEKPVGLELRSLNNLIMRCLENSEHHKQVDSITRTNGWIIGYLADNADKDVYQRDLEEHFTITRSTASRVIDLMVKKGLVERRAVACDARLKKLVLTPKALAVSKLMKEDGRKLEAALTDGFTEAERADLLRYIRRMKENIRQNI